MMMRGLKFGTSGPDNQPLCYYY